MSCSMRDYKSGDEQCAKILLEVSLEQYGLDADFATTDSDIQDINASYIEGGGMFRVLEKAGVLVGMYRIYRLTDKTCELRKMYLHPDLKGQGLGKKLMNDALERARQLGFHEMTLETNHDLFEVVAMYKKYGLEVCAPDHLSSRCDCRMKLEL